jgi:hypothetical protein
MPRLELIFLHSANGGGCFRWRDEDSTYLQSERDPRPKYVGLRGLPDSATGLRSDNAVCLVGSCQCPSDYGNRSLSLQLAKGRQRIGERMQGSLNIRLPHQNLGSI